MLRRLAWREAARVARLDLLRAVLDTGNDGRFRIECGALLLAEIARCWLGDFVLDLRRIKLHRLAQPFIDHEEQSAVVRAEFLRVGRVGPITFGATFHVRLSCEILGTPPITISRVPPQSLPVTRRLLD